MSKHTPGPWCVETPLGDDILSIVQDGKQTFEWMILADVALPDGDEPGEVSRDEAHANARLIAAAPEMLAMLKRLRAMTGQYISSVFGEADALIAKAEGADEVEEQVRGIKRASNKPTPEGEGK